jgi:hypothetical protein
MADIRCVCLCLCWLRRRGVAPYTQCTAAAQPLLREAGGRGGGSGWRGRQRRRSRQPPAARRGALIVVMVVMCFPSFSQLRSCAHNARVVDACGHAGSVARAA